MNLKTGDARHLLAAEEIFAALQAAVVKFISEQGGGADGTLTNAPTSQSSRRPPPKRALPALRLVVSSN